MSEIAANDTEHAQISDGQYIGIAAALAVLTAIEVGLYYLKHDTATTVVLLLLMVLKFAMVVGYFMHLKFDSPVLRQLFVGGLMLAATIYTITLFMFGAFHV
jgi:cytochrome c oxidase subunit 4